MAEPFRYLRRALSSLLLAGRGAGGAPERGIAVLLVMAVMASLLLGGVITTGIRIANMRGGGQSLSGKRAYYCAEAGLADGKNFFRANYNNWPTYLAPNANFVYSGQATSTGLTYQVRMFDNNDEYAPTPNNPNMDRDRTVLLVSTCTDPLLQDPVVLRQYITLNPIVPPGPSVSGPSTVNQTYPNSAKNKTNVLSFSGGGQLDSSGGIVQGTYNGTSTAGVDVRNDQIVLSTTYNALPFIWLSNSNEGTISKINTATGQEIGRYQTGPAYGNPSRTTVDLDGNVWVGNRGNNTMTKIGLKEMGNCIDRNNNGIIDSSTGPQDVKPWTGAWGTTTGAQDECILMNVALHWPGLPDPPDIRMVAISKDNNMFVGGFYANTVYKVRSSDGVILAGMYGQQGHYGGVVDGNGYLWSMHSGSGYVEKIAPDFSTDVRYPIGHGGYGVALDKAGHVWTNEYGSRFSRMNPDGTGLVVFTKFGGISGGQGIAVDPSGDVWLAESLSYNFVDRHDNNGVFKGRYYTGQGATGVAVAADGAIWSSNYYGNSTSRIDPKTNAVTTYPIGSGPYNYSDMTGFVARSITARLGTWTTTLYCGAFCNSWQSVSWTASVPAGTTVSARARSAYNFNLLGSAPWQAAASGQIFPATGAGSLPGRVIQVEIKLTTTVDGTTPTIYDVTIVPWP